MKKWKKIVAFVLCFSLLATLNTNVLAASEPAEKDVFSDVFLEEARNADGAFAYAIDAAILKSYQDDPVVFIGRLGDLSVSDYEFFQQTLISSMYYGGDWNSFKTFLGSYATENATAEYLLEAANEYEAEELIWEAAYREYTSQPLPEGLFSVAILDEAIEAHADSYIYDQEFCGYLREMYELDPVLFLKTIEDFSSENISQIAQQISYAQYLNLGDVERVKELAYGVPTSVKSLDASERALRDSFAIKIDSFVEESIAEAQAVTAQAAIFEEQNITPAAAANIGAMYYSNVASPPNELEINKPATLTSTISGLSANTQYKIELWARHDNSSNSNLKATKTYTSNSSGTIKAALNVTFSSPGKIWTTIKVYQGSSLVISRTGGDTDNIYARWRISLPLGTNHSGTLSFYYASGAKAYSCMALGKSAKNYHYSQFEGHTPPGDYYGWTTDLSGNRKDYPVESYGPNKVIEMVGNDDPGYSNPYVDSDTDTSKARSGIWIHGGRSQDTYTPTYGCVRIHDNDIKTITNFMDSWLSAGYHTRGRVSITR